MCGIAGVFGFQGQQAELTQTLSRMVASQHHRGPDAEGLYFDPSGTAALGHNRLSIIDLSELGRQPMSNHDGRLQIVFNGEIYNYRELRRELSDYPYRSQTDTEVIFAAFEKWGTSCLDHFIGMFAFLLWDEREGRLFAARDRFGVKPLYYAVTTTGTLLIASEIKALHAAGISREPDATAWSNYLSAGLYDHSARTFWQGIQALPAGHALTWQPDEFDSTSWYKLSERVGNEFDERPTAQVQAEYLELLTESVKLRFRSDVPVGINLSGGLDSATLLGLVQRVQGAESAVKAFTFTTGDENYDELPWVRQMLARTKHPAIICQLAPEEVPALAASVQAYEDEPCGGLPTLAYAKLFEQARAEGVTVLLDGQGMDEQWAGYDYYRAALNGSAPTHLVQGTQDSPVRPECLTPEFRALAASDELPQPFPDRLRNLQYRDTCFTKIPRALRFNDRISMRATTELREPFLDHRLFEIAFRQPAERKIADGAQKWFLRQLAKRLLPQDLVEAPKRPLQTPQREWLRGPLRPWVEALLDQALSVYGGEWLNGNAVHQQWQLFRQGASDNSFYIWQWLSLGLLHQTQLKSL